MQLDLVPFHFHSQGLFPTWTAFTVIFHYITGFLNNFQTIYLPNIIPKHICSLENSVILDLKEESGKIIHLERVHQNVPSN